MATTENWGNATLEAIRRFAGRQVIDFYEAFRLLGGRGDPDIMPAATREGLCDILRSFGYQERWVYDDDCADAGLRWVREPWPIDGRVLAAGPSMAYRRIWSR